MRRLSTKIRAFQRCATFPAAFVKYDEIYQPKAWSRDKVNVLLSLDPAKLEYDNNPKIDRAKHNFPVDGARCTAKGILFHARPHRGVWLDSGFRTMYFEAIKWGSG